MEALDGIQFLINSKSPTNQKQFKEDMKKVREISHKRAFPKRNMDEVSVVSSILKSPLASPIRSPSIDIPYSIPSEPSSPRRNNRREYEDDIASMADLAAEEVSEKRKYLRLFARKERRGTVLPIKFTMSDCLEEMRETYETLVAEESIDKSVKFQQNLLITACTGVEMLNDFSPFRLELNGWTQSIVDDITDWNDIFEGIHEKYGQQFGASKWPPEVRLLLGIVGSAIMHHWVQKIDGIVPGARDVLRSNPNLMKDLKQAVSSSSSDYVNKQANPSANSGMGGIIGSLFGGMFGGGAAKTAPVPMGVPQAPQKPIPPPPTAFLSGMPVSDSRVESEVNSVIQKARQNATIVNMSDSDDDESIAGSQVIGNNGKINLSV